MLEHLQILLRNSVEATFIIPSFFFDEDKCDPDGRFKELRVHINSSGTWISWKCWKFQSVQELMMNIWK